MSFPIDSIVLLLVSGKHSVFGVEMKLSIGALSICILGRDIESIMSNDSMHS